MGMTAAERQRAYRKRHAEEGERINMAVDAHTKRALERLARHHGTSQRAMLEKVLADTEGRLVETLDNTGAYYGDVTA